MRRLALLVGLLAALIPLACGGGDKSSAPPATTAAAERASSSPVALAAAATREEGSARFSMTVEISGGPTAGTITGEGAFAGRRGNVTLDLSDVGAGGAFVDGKMEAIFDGLVLYMKFPSEIAQALPGGKAWIRLDLAALGKEQGLDFEQLAQATQGDPSQSLDYLLAAGDDFERVGAEDVRGVETPRYRGTIDLEKVVEQAPAGTREAYRRLVGLSGTSTIPAEAWIDGEGRVRRMRYEQPLPGQKDALTTTTVELYDFGAEVDAEPPPAEEILDLQDLIGGTN